MKDTAAAEPMLRMRSVGHSYPGAPDVLRGIDLSLGHGELAFLTGPSGAGKSTLLRLIALILRPSRGDVWVDGRHLVRLSARQVAAHRRRIGVVFQNARLLHDRSVFDNVALPLLIQGHSGADIGRRVRGALDAVGLLQRERMSPVTLSGGEQQRVAIARAVVTRPPLLLADEPTGNLDPTMAREVMNLFLRFNKVGVTVLIATHAIGLIGELPYRRLHLEDGVLQQDGSA